MSCFCRSPIAIAPAAAQSYAEQAAHYGVLQMWAAPCYSCYCSLASIALLLNLKNNDGVTALNIVIALNR